MPQLSGIIKRLKKQGQRVVFTNGCFDILHYGHVRYLEEARAKGDVLVVGVNSDASVRRLKGRKRPIVGAGDRAGVIAALESVGYVVVFTGDTPLAVIQKIRPDVLVKGADWKLKDIVGARLVAGYGGTVATVRFAQGRSTTRLINTIAQKFA